MSCVSDEFCETYPLFHLWLWSFLVKSDNLRHQLFQYISFDYEERLTVNILPYRQIKGILFEM